MSAETRKSFLVLFFKKEHCLLSCVLLAAAAAPPDFDRLFAALRAAPNSASAEAVEAALTSAWHDQATQSVQVLIDQAAEKLAAGKPQEALADCDAAIVLQPQLADLWRRRAEARLALGDEEGAAADLAQALQRDPRQLPALVDLSRLEEARKQYGQAMAAWQKLLDLDPKTQGGTARLERLRRRAHGEPI
jgi:tetratricopeptide (TPR) repeat protein